MKTVSLIIGLPLVFSYFAALVTKQKLESVLPITYFLAVIWLLLFGISDKLSLGISLLLPTALIFIVIFVLKLRKQIWQKNNLKNLVSPAVLFFVTSTLFMYKQSSPMRFYEWDEFSYWGTAVKALFLFDRLSPFASAGIAFPEFVPGAPLFPYLVSEINGTWHEGHVYWAYQVLIVSLVSYFLKDLNWKKYKLSIIIFPIMLLSITFFYNSFQTVYADPLLGIVFASILILSTSKDFALNKTYVINLVILTTYLSLLKDIGIFFSLIGIFLATINLFFTLKSTNRSLTAKLLQSFSIIVACLIPIVWLRLKWASLLEQTGFTSDRSVTEVVKNVLNGSENPIEKSIWPELKANFISRIFDGKLTQINSASISIADWFFVFAIILLLLIFTEKSRSERIRQGIFSITILIGFVAYLLILLFLYAMVFSQNEALGLASFERYTSAYLIGIVIYISYKVVGNLLNSNGFKDISIASVFWIAIFMLQSSPANLLTYLSNPSFQSDNWRNAYGDRSWLIAEVNLPPESRVWIIAQHTVGFEFYLFQYELLPATVGKIPWSIGSISGPGDIWTDSTYDVEKWSQALANYDYVFVNNVTESFISEFGSMFDDPSTLDKPGIYKVDLIGSEVNLVKIR